MTMEHPDYCPFVAEKFQKLAELSGEIDRLKEGKLNGDKLEFETMDQLRIRLLEVRVDYLEEERG